MDKTKRKAVIAGNWKMNKTPSEAKELLTAIVPAVKDADCVSTGKKAFRQNLFFLLS